MVIYSNRDRFKNYLFKYKYEKQEIFKPDQRVRKPNRNPHLSVCSDEFNTIVQSCRKLKLLPIVRTPSGSIKKNRVDLATGSYDVQVIRNSKNNVLKGFIVTIILGRKIWVFKYGYIAAKGSNMTGHKAYNEFLDTCKDLGIDIEKYALPEEEALKYKNQIESPMIMNFQQNKEIPHVNHIDLNAAWPSAICEKYPELEPVYSKLTKDAKNCLNGYLQSKYISYKYAKLAMTGVNGCNVNIRRLWKALHEQDFGICGINTDGIWYYDKLNQNRLYHDKNEGSGFHKWKHDYTDCIWYASSDGQYYFETPEGKFEVRARGYYTYEAIKPREEWTKEDYFKAIMTLCDIYYDEDSQMLIVRSGYESEN